MLKKQTCYVNIINDYTESGEKEWSTYLWQYVAEVED